MKEARVWHFEDDDRWLGIVARHVGRGRHRHIGQSTDIKSAMEAVESFPGSAVLKPSVFVLEGNLTDVDSYDDARLIAGRIRELAIPAWIIGLSREDLRKQQVAVNVVLLKQELLPGVLNRLLDILPEPAPGLHVHPLDSSGSWGTRRL